MPGRLLLPIEEPAMIVIFRQNTHFGATEKTVPAAGDGVVGQVAQGFGQELQEECKGAPEATELLQDEQHCVGTGEQILVRLG